MLNNIIDKNIMFLQNRGVKMNSDDRTVYKYGLQILYYYIIDLLVIFSLAYCFGRLYETIIMTFIFAVLQVFGGGYHAKTPLKCLLTMIVGGVVGNILTMLTAKITVVNIVLIIAISYTVLILTPVVNTKHPVSEKVKHRSKLIFRVVITSLWIVLAALIYLSKLEEIAVVVVTFELYLISLITAKIKNK